MFLFLESLLRSQKIKVVANNLYTSSTFILQIKMDAIIEKLKNYTKEDIKFLKREWQEWIEEGKFNLFEKKTGANVQVVYGILDPKKIKNIRLTRDSKRYELKLYHSLKYEISVFIKFDQPNKGNLGILTYYKHPIK